MCVKRQEERLCNREVRRWFFMWNSQTNVAESLDNVKACTLSLATDFGCCLTLMFPSDRPPIL